MKKILSLTLGFMLCASVSAQLTVDGSQTNSQLAQLISGSGIAISNVSVDCQTTNSGKGYGRYNALNSNLGITEGLLLTTGSINNALGPNNDSRAGSYFGNDRYASNNSTNPVKALIQTQSGRSIYEFCEFSFDITPVGDTLKFDYVFASEEYDEYVNSSYNDVFGFFITGPNPAGGTFTDKNLAVIPGTTQSVAINNVNNGQANAGSNPSGPCKNCQYYQSNRNGTSVQYDGFTKNLKAVSPVKPCQTYRLKLVIADATDRQYDSGVFIEKISSPSNINITSSTPAGTPFAIEGCNPATITFSRPSASLLPMTLTYFISGTATNGVDYPAIGNTNNANPKYITIGILQSTASFVLNPYADGIADNDETVTFSLDNPDCPAGLNVSHTIYIRDSIFPSLNPAYPSICTGQSVTMTGSAPAGTTYSWSPATNLSSATVSNPTASPTTSTNYTMTVKLGSCTESRRARVTVNPLPDTKSLSAGSQVCFGGSSNVLMNASQSGISYQLTSQPSGTAIGAALTGNGGNLSFNTGPLAGTGSFGVTATNPATGCSRQVASPVSVAAPATPVRVASNLDQNTCLVNGNNWITFIAPSSDRAIVSINANGNNLGNVTATGYVNGTPIDVPACNNPQPLYTTTVMNRRWTIKPETQPSGPVDVRLYFTAAEYNQLKDFSNINQNPNDDASSIAAMVLSKYSGLNENGSFADNCGNGVTTLHNSSANGNASGLFTGFDANGRYVQFSIPSFSEFWLHGKSTTAVSPLPIVLKDFKATCTSDGVKLDWVTASEINNDYFTLEKSTDGIQWRSMGEVKGAGSSNSTLAYTLTDSEPNTGTRYYRLTQTDYDGHFERFDPISVSCGQGTYGIQVYPNPAVEYVQLSLYSDTQSETSVGVYDMNGKNLLTRRLQLVAGDNTFRVDLAGFAAGVYVVRLDTGESQKIVVGRN